MGDNTEYYSDSSQPLNEPSDHHRGWGKRFFRLFAISVGTIILGLFLGGVGLFFLFQGGAIENKALNDHVERSITSFLGSEFNVALGHTKFEFHGIGKISITSSDVTVRKIGAPQPVARLDKVLVGVSPVSLLRGKPRVHNVTVDKSTLDIRQFVTASKPDFPKDINAVLEKFGTGLEQVKQRILASQLKHVSIRNSVLIGFKPGKRSTGEIDVKEFRLEVNSPERLELALNAHTGISDLSLKSFYQHQDEGIKTLDVSFSGLDLREWLHDSNLPRNEDIPIAVESKVKGHMSMAFNEDNTVQQPVLNLTIGEGKLYLGRKGTTEIGRLAINLRVFPRLNQVILERSHMFVGGFRAQLVGGITPVDINKGLAGNIDYTLFVERAQGTATQTGERVFPGSMIVEGGFNRARKLLNIDQWRVVVASGSMVGSASLGFKHETPSLVLNGVSQGVPMAAVKQFWPVFLATPVRKWVQEHVHGGMINSAKLTASIPGGIIGRLHKGKRMEPEHLKLEVDAENVRFDTFGNLPPIRSAAGTVVVQGMRTDVKLTKGITYVADGDPVQVIDGSFAIPDMAKRPLIAEASMVANGPVSSMAQIADSKPLNVMNRLEMAPSQWSGNGEIDLVANFPLKRNVKYPDVSWQALVRLNNATSSKPVTGRKIKNANVVVDVSPDKAVITGKSTIDGITGNVRFIEPVGKDSKVKRKRVLMARMGQRERRNIGLVVEPVINGPIDVVMEQREGRRQADISVDLRQAEISLPWIGWRKGKDIPAKASFEMELAKNRTNIDHLVLTGQGFGLKGDMVIDKSGIRSANFPQLALNENDNLDIRIRRQRKNNYTITANGDYFDSRVLINKLFHTTEKDDGNSDAENGSFDLSVNIKKVKGFGNREVDNLILHYSVKDGWLDSLSLNTLFANSQRATIKAETKRNITTFQIKSSNAGSALSFLNIYTRMRDGKLVADLKRNRQSPFVGTVDVKNFVVIDEPKLKSLVSNKQLDAVDRDGTLKDKFNQIQTNRVRFLHASSQIEKGVGYLKMDGSLTGVQIGLTYNGTIYDENNRMNLAGTFMPAFGISRVVAAIPFVGQLLSNGRDSGLIGITYLLTGPFVSPKLELNPLSVVAPGVFKKVFEQRDRIEN